MQTISIVAVIIIVGLWLISYYSTLREELKAKKELHNARKNLMKIMGEQTKNLKPTMSMREIDDDNDDDFCFNRNELKEYLWRNQN